MGLAESVERLRTGGFGLPLVFLRAALASGLALWLIACTTAIAQSQVTEQIAQATRLLETGRFAEAQAIVTTLRNAPEPDLQVLFLSGALHLLHGRFQEAAGEFRLMLARDPALVRPRLELARALFMAKQYEAARYHFEQTLASSLPEQVKRNVIAHLVAIREHLPSVSFSIEVLSDSNPKQATSSQTVQIGNLTFRLNENAQSKAARGLLLSTQGRIPLSGDSSWFARGYLDYFDYEGGELDQWYTQAAGGKRVNIGRHSIDFEFGGHLANYAGAALYRGIIGRMSDFIRIYPTLGVSLALDSKQLDYSKVPFLKGWQHSASTDLRYALDTRSYITGGVAYLRGSAQEAAYSFDRYALTLRYALEWKAGWISSVSWQYAHSHFDDLDPFFGVVRTDRENLAEIGITNRYLSYKRFAPRLVLGYSERQSNIELYSYHRAYVRVGLITEF